MKREATSFQVLSASKRINKQLNLFNEEMSQVDESAIQTALSKIMDPELGRPITDLKLVDRMNVSAGSVDLEFHLTAPFCPPVFALKIASDIKAGLLSVPGVTSAKVTLRGHYLADAVNKQVNKPTQPGT
jgi:metal-sulfur cluster biosynthetic enzyme